MYNQVIIFEDGSESNFYPIAQTRPLWDIRCGAFLFHERIAAVLKNKQISYKIRAELSDLCGERGLPLQQIQQGDGLLLVNALCAAFEFDIPIDTVVLKGKRIAAVNLSAGSVSKHFSELSSPSFNPETLAGCSEFSKMEVPSEWFFPEYIWECIHMNGEMIRRDFEIMDKSGSLTGQYKVTFSGNEDQIIIEDNVSLDPFVFIDATKGPVIIKKGCVLNPFTRIEGPCFLGDKTVITGAKIREGCSFGPDCRIGGEVEDAIFQSYSNKYHDGFIGHAYVGEWVNLGAMTSNSDLRNDYSNVKCVLPSGVIDTGTAKTGCIIGDFVKTSIGTLINTGSIIGTGAMAVFSGRMTPPLIPDFCRFIKNELRDTGSADESVKTNRIACKRRGKTLTNGMELVMKSIYSKGKAFRSEKVLQWNDNLK